MDGRRSEPTASLDLAYDAETLVRSLDGVVTARVHTGPRGIDAIHVTARDDHAARFMAGHVRSALLAGLATPVTAARIHVRVDQALDGHPGGNGGPVAAIAPEPEPDTDPADAPAADFGDQPRHRIWLVEPRTGRPHGERPIGRGVPTDDAGTDATPAAVERPDPVETPSRLQRPRLVAVDIERPGDGRVVCRVSIAHGTLVHRAEAVAVDLPGAAAQAAAQAAVRALVDAGIRALELNGLREVEIAGREYVLVALRMSDTSRRHRSGSAPIVGSPERSAAEAAVAAANELI